MAVYDDKNKLKGLEEGIGKGASKASDGPAGLATDKVLDKVPGLAKNQGAALNATDKVAGKATEAAVTAATGGAGTGTLATVSGKVVEKVGVKKIVIIVGACLLAPVIIVIFLISNIANLKLFHMGQTLSNAGHATTQSVMRNSYSDVAYKRAQLEDPKYAYTVPSNESRLASSVNTSGNKSSAVLAATSQRPKGGIADRIKKIDPKKINKFMNNDIGYGGFQIIKKNGRVTGYKMQRNEYDFDKTSQELFGQNYDALSPTQKLKVDATIEYNAQYSTEDAFNTNSRTFRNAWFYGLRQTYGVRTNKTQEYLDSLDGNTTAESRTAEINNDYDYISPSNVPTSAVSGVQKAADNTKSILDKAVNDGQNVDNKAVRVNDAINDGMEQAGITGGTESFAEELLKKSSIGTLILTLYCVLRDSVNNIEAANSATEARAQKYAHDAQTDKDQIKRYTSSGEHISGANSLWDGNDNVPNAESSPLYSEAVNRQKNLLFDDETVKNLPIAYVPPEGINDGFKVAEKAVAGCIPEDEVDLVCSNVMNPNDPDVKEASKNIMAKGGSMATVDKIIEAMRPVFRVRGGGYRNIDPPTGLPAVNFFMKLVVGNYSGAYFSGAEVGTDRYNTAAIATNYQNTAVSRGVSFGRRLSKNEADKVQALALNDLINKSNQKPIFERYFATSNPYSIINRVSAIMPTSIGSLISNARRGLANFGRTLSSLLSGKTGLVIADKSGLFKNVGAAATQTAMARLDYGGIEQWGWSEGELKLVREDENYTVFGNEDWIMNSKNIPGGTIDEKMSFLDQKYGKCYIPYAQTDDVVEYDGVCQSGAGEDKLGLALDEAVHYRLQKLRYSIIDQLTDTTITEESDTETIEGLEDCDTNPKEGKNEYVQLPSKSNDYSISPNTPEADRWGSPELVSMICTVAKRWAEENPKNKIIVGDLNALSGHVSHDIGVDVDITTNGQIAANTSGNDKKSMELAHMFADTDIVEVIGYEGQSVIKDFTQYVKENKLSGTMEAWDGHSDHFHVRILSKYALKANGQ